ncbi:putative cyanophycin synthase [Clostridiales bacterium oral taxon 876 str. F0540]|nr:putative cyanophycin synthase [Clostridiales bacterium oral taxon 876 str. F0540]
MKITSIKVYEGNNIKRRKRIIRVTIENSYDAQINKYLKSYFRLSFLLGFKEKLIDIEIKKNLYNVWVTYTQEEVSKYLLSNIFYDMDNAEKIIDKADNLVKKGFLYDTVKGFRDRNIPVIDINEDLFQIGYGKNSIIIGRNFQSYENMVEVEISRNRKTLWQCLRYAHIPKVEGKVLYSIEEIKEIEDFKYPINLRNIDKTADIKITIADKEELNRVLDNMMKMYTRAFIYSGSVNYRIICYKGEVKVILKKEDGYKIIEISDRSMAILEVVDTISRLRAFCKTVYKSISIEFMYIDIIEDKELKVVDIGSVFDIGEELKEVKDKIISSFIDCVVDEGIGTIPIVSVTGTNGKTTTARVINYLLNKIGYKSALTSTGGIFIDGQKIKNGDTTGFLSAREVLTDRSVEAAVMETARGGIYRNGLGYEMAKAAVITSISEDHIGMDGIENMEDLIGIKTVILNEIDQDGKIVLKAQKELIPYISGKNNVCLYSTEKNEIIKEHVNNKGEAFYVENDYIVHNINSYEEKILNIKDIPFTHGGCSKGNTLNIMAAIAAVSSICNDTKKIVDLLSELKCDLYFNPGRQNILELHDFKVILDYGHNSEAFNEIFSIAQSLKPSKLTAIIAAPGDRMNKYIKELGTISARFCNHIIIREQEDLRGRKAGETAALIREGIIEEGFDENEIEVVYKEQEALMQAMERAAEGEIIVLFTQCLDVIIPTINSFLKKSGYNGIAEDLNFSH